MSVELLRAWIEKWHHCVSFELKECRLKVDDGMVCRAATTNWLTDLLNWRNVMNSIFRCWACWVNESSLASYYCLYLLAPTLQPSINHQNYKVLIVVMTLDCYLCYCTTTTNAASISTLSQFNSEMHICTTAGTRVLEHECFRHQQRRVFVYMCVWVCILDPHHSA